MHKLHKLELDDREGDTLLALSFRSVGTTRLGNLATHGTSLSGRIFESETAPAMPPQSIHKDWRRKSEDLIISVFCQHCRS